MPRSASFSISRRAKITPSRRGYPTSAPDGCPGCAAARSPRSPGSASSTTPSSNAAPSAGVSASVLDAVARALQLDDAERAHLFHLAHAADGTSAGMRPRRRPTRWTPRPSLQWVLDAITAAGDHPQRPDGPARHQPPRPGDALIRLRQQRRRVPRTSPATPSSTTTPTASTPTGTLAADTCVAILRTEAGRDPHDKALHDLVGELSTRSADFRRRWSAHNVRLHGAGAKHFHHPVVGDLELAYESVDMISEPGLTMTIYVAEPASPTAQALDLLASWDGATAPPRVTT